MLELPSYLVYNHFRQGGKGRKARGFWFYDSYLPGEGILPEKLGWGLQPPMTGRKNYALQVPPVVPYKALENFSKALHRTTRGTCSARFFRPVIESEWGGAAQNPYSIYDQNLRYSLRYLWPDPYIKTLFHTCVIISPLVQTNVKFPRGGGVKLLWT